MMSSCQCCNNIAGTGKESSLDASRRLCLLVPTSAELIAERAARCGGVDGVRGGTLGVTGPDDNS